MLATTELIQKKSLGAEEIRTYQQDGFLLLRGMLSPEDAGELRGEAMEIIEALGGLGMTKLRQTGQYLRNSSIDALIHSEQLRSIASTLMGGPSTLYMPFTAVKSARGGGEFHFHQDNQYTRFDGPGCNCWFALNSMNEANGCLRMVPGSHKNGTLAYRPSPDGDTHRRVQFDPENFVSILMEPGYCVVFSRLTVHGSGPNGSIQPRVGYAVQFHRDDVRGTWDGHEGALLKEHPRWPDEGVESLAALKLPTASDAH